MSRVLFGIGALAALTLLLVLLLRSQSAPQPKVLPLERLVAAHSDGGRPATSSDQPSTRTPVQTVSEPLPLDAVRVRALARRWMPEYVKRGQDFNPQFYSAFGREKVFRLTEGRLLALAYPDALEPEAIAIASDASLGIEERSWGIRLLGYLAQANRRATWDTLRALSADKIPGIREMSVHVISNADPTRRERDLYVQECYSGNYAAFEALSRSKDSSVTALMNGLKNGPEAARPGIALFVDEVLKKHALLGAPDVETKLAEVLSGPESEELTDWALTIVDQEPSPKLLNLIRDRLDRIPPLARKKYDREQQLDLSENDPRAKPFEELWRTSVSTSVIVEATYDKALLVYWSNGGKMSDLEMARLHHFGYGVDPKKRLAELLENKP